MEDASLEESTAGVLPRGGSTSAAKATNIPGAGIGKGHSQMDAAVAHNKDLSSSDPLTSDPTPPPSSSDLREPGFSLPGELIDAILSYLPAIDLASVCQVCRSLRAYAMSERLWQNLIQENVPGCRITTPYPCESFRELYIAHDRRWFLPRYRIWFSGRDMVGKLILVKYDQRRGCIEGYRVVAVSNRTTYHSWPPDANVVVHAFEPQIILHMDRPVLKLAISTPSHAVEDDATQLTTGQSSPASEQSPSQGALRQSSEMLMVIDAADNFHHYFMYAQPLLPTMELRESLGQFPYYRTWPPPAVPSQHRVLGSSIGLDEYPALPSSHPKRREDISNLAFYIRTSLDSSFASHNFRHFVEDGRAAEFETFSTIDPIYYAPTEDKPFRGIWVGDYSGHGCEFLLIHQPDDTESFDESTLGKLEGETDKEFEKRRRDARIYRGRLEAIKLTGDPNVPRGEYTFIVDDLGESGFDCVIDEPPFEGVRVVKSLGHVAGTGFRNERYIESRLLVISPNRLAQYWIGFGHISFFERVNFDQFLN